jgi:hypothetical protein
VQLEDYAGRRSDLRSLALDRPVIELMVAVDAAIDPPTECPRHPVEDPVWTNPFDVVRMASRTKVLHTPSLSNDSWGK